MPDRSEVAKGSRQVDHNLSDADKLQGLHKAGHEAGTLVPGAPEHAEASVFGVVTGPVVVSIAMLVFLAIVLWKGGVRAITGALDRQIATIRQQLDDATKLRTEAETLRDDYQRRIGDAETSARDMVTHAEAEAAAIVAQARVDAADLVERRGRMAEDKIAAAERQAIADVRTRAADAAAQAAATLIATHLDAGADKALVDRGIAGLGRLN